MASSSIKSDRRISYLKALNETLDQEMGRDPSVILMGEDVAGGAGKEDQGIVDAWGGAFGYSKGLITKYGAERVRDTPISETGFIGAAVGMAATGLRPIAELMFVGFYGVCADQITNNAAKMHYMFGGKVTLPLTILTSIGIRGGQAAQHSETLYSVFTHFPGLKCVVPSDPYTAKGLLATSIRDDDPVIYFIHKRLMSSQGFDFEPLRGSGVPEEPYIVPIGKADVVKEGYGCNHSRDWSHYCGGHGRRWGVGKVRCERRSRGRAFSVAAGRRHDFVLGAEDAACNHRRRGLSALRHLR